MESAKKITKKHMYIAMGGSLIPVPLFDLIFISGTQLKMLSEHAALYNIPFSEKIVKSMVASIVGSYVPTAISYGIAGSFAKALPGAYFSTLVTLPALSGGLTYAIGNVFVKHFESGGTFLDFNTKDAKDYFKEQLEKGKNIASKMKTAKEDKKEEVKEEVAATT